MEFIETPVFTRQVLDLLSDDQYRVLQIHLLLYPDSGSVIPESGGLRKIRWAVSGQGKRGGVRVLYYWVVSSDVVYLIYMFRKGRQDDLSPDQVKALRKTVQKELL